MSRGRSACYYPPMIRVETVCGITLYDSLREMFSKPYVYIPQDKICLDTGTTRKQIANTLSDIRKRTNIDIEAVLHTGGWCLVPRNTDNKFNLINFRNPPATDHLPDTQREALINIWPHVQEVERIDLIRNDRTIHVLNPTFPVWIYEMLCTMVSVFEKENRGLMWQDIYPPHIGDMRGKLNLRHTTTTLNRFCKSRSIPYRLLASPHNSLLYRFFKN